MSPVRAFRNSIFERIGTEAKPCPSLPPEVCIFVNTIHNRIPQPKCSELTGSATHPSAYRTLPWVQNAVPVLERCTLRLMSCKDFLYWNAYMTTSEESSGLRENENINGTLSGFVFTVVVLLPSINPAYLMLEARSRAPLDAFALLSILESLCERRILSLPTTGVFAGA